MPRVVYDVRTVFGKWIDGLRKPRDWQWWTTDAKVRWVGGKRKEFARLEVKREMLMSEKEKRIRSLLADLEVLIRGI